MIDENTLSILNTNINDLHSTADNEDVKLYLFNRF